MLYYDVEARVDGTQKRHSLNKHCKSRSCSIPVDVFIEMGFDQNDPIEISVAGVNAYGKGNFSDGALLFRWWQNKEVGTVHVVGMEEEDALLEWSSILGIKHYEVKWTQSGKIHTAKTRTNTFKVKTAVLPDSNLQVRAVTGCGNGPYSTLLQNAYIGVTEALQLQLQDVLKPPGKMHPVNLSAGKNACVLHIHWSLPDNDGG